MKPCRFCGNLLEDSSNWCPSCMQRQKDAVPQENAPLSPSSWRFSRKIRWAVLGSVFSTVAFLTAFFLLRAPLSSSALSPVSSSVQNSETHSAEFFFSSASENSQYSFSSPIETAESSEESVPLSTNSPDSASSYPAPSENTVSSSSIPEETSSSEESPVRGCTWDSADIETFQKLLTEHISGATPNLLHSPGLVSVRYETMEISTQMTGPEKYSLESKDSFMPSYGASWIYNTVVSPSDHSLDDGGDTPLPFSTYSYSLKYMGYTGSAHLFRVYYLPIRANFSSGSFHSSQALELVKKLDIPGMAWKDLYNTAGRYETFCSFPLNSSEEFAGKIQEFVLQAGRGYSYFDYRLLDFRDGNISVGLYFI